jgi:hypothetical protein
MRAVLGACNRGRKSEHRDVETKFCQLNAFAGVARQAGRSTRRFQGWAIPSRGMSARKHSQDMEIVWAWICVGIMAAGALVLFFGGGHRTSAGVVAGQTLMGALLAYAASKRQRFS